MLKYVHGDIFKTPAKTIVNTVNTEGVMGKGIALKFKLLYPEMFKKYQYLCDTNQLKIGILWLHKTENKWILNFPTKKSWRNRSSYDYIELGLQKFVNTYKDKGITSIAFPKIGCGNGGLDWSIVKPMMEKYLKNLPIDIFVYVKDYNERTEHEDIDNMKNWLSDNPEYISFMEFEKDLLERSHENLLSAILNDEEEVRKIWSELKRKGYLEKSDINFYIEELSESFYNLLLSLSYIEEFEVLNQRKNKFEKALLLKPNISSKMINSNNLEAKLIGDNNESK